MSKIAQQIAQEFRSNDDAAAAAEARAIGKDQVWDGDGYTIYVFADNSLLAQSGPSQIAVDADDRESVLAYIAWLGVDWEYDQQRIDAMMEAFD